MEDQRFPEVVSREIEELTCSICLGLCRNKPVLTPCGHMFCRPCIDMLDQLTCPSCRSPFFQHQLRSAPHALVNAMLKTKVRCSQCHENMLMALWDQHLLKGPCQAEDNLQEYRCNRGRCEFSFPSAELLEAHFELHDEVHAMLQEAIATGQRMPSYPEPSSDKPASFEKIMVPDGEKKLAKLASSESKPLACAQCGNACMNVPVLLDCQHVMCGSCAVVREVQKEKKKKKKRKRARTLPLK